MPNWVTVAKRENNKLRSYLLVNKVQAKHVPAKPQDTLSMMNELGEMVKKAYPKERILVVGFAETATAIGAVMCSHPPASSETQNQAPLQALRGSHAASGCS